MPVHPLFQQILDDLQRRPDYKVRDDADWPDLPDVTLVEDEGGAVQRVTDRSNELTRRSQARQAYDVEREATRVPLSGAKR